MGTAPPTAPCIIEEAGARGGDVLGLRKDGGPVPQRGQIATQESKKDNVRKTARHQEVKTWGEEDQAKKAPMGTRPRGATTF